jgi:hypothetical protein
VPASDGLTDSILSRTDLHTSAFALSHGELWVTGMLMATWGVIEWNDAGLGHAWAIERNTNRKVTTDAVMIGTFLGMTIRALFKKATI